MRIDEIKAATAINVEAERKVAQLNDEIQALARNLRIKDQTIQETGVKIELMERRMETVKKQADTITDLENELAKARKQERAYEEAMEQLQADLDALEQDNAKLKALANNPERQPSTTQVVEVEAVPTEGNLETSYLLEQVCLSSRRLVRSELNTGADRRPPRYGPLPALREFVPQGARPAQRDRGAPRAARALPARTNTSTRPLDALGLGLGFRRRAAPATDAALARGRVQAAVPRSDQVHVVPAARRPLGAQGEPGERAADDEGVDPAQEDAGVPAVRAQDAGGAAGEAAQGAAGADEPYRSGLGLRVRMSAVLLLCRRIGYPRILLLLYPSCMSPYTPSTRFSCIGPCPPHRCCVCTRRDGARQHVAYK